MKAIRITLTIASSLSFVYALMLACIVETALHEIELLILLCISAISLSGVGIMLGIEAIVEKMSDFEVSAG